MVPVSEAGTVVAEAAAEEEHDGDDQKPDHLCRGKQEFGFSIEGDRERVKADDNDDHNRDPSEVDTSLDRKSS